MKKLFFLFLLLSSSWVWTQNYRVEPPNWWIGFNQQKLQLLIHAEGIVHAKVALNYPGISIKQIHQADSPNYLFVDLEIGANTQAGTFEIKIDRKNYKTLRIPYEIKTRTKNPENYKGFDTSDVIYLITPDRFANGNPANDAFPDLLETKVDRANNYGRHGGDIAGITQHLDYISEMGFTAIWPSPLLENNMPQASYHGYAITDFYKVDPRFGTLDQYKNLGDEAREKGLKLIMDMVANHCGSEHWWMKDLPFSDWINQQSAYEKGENIKNSNHRRTANMDPYAAQTDKKGLAEGWFVRAMPDLNQRNPFMAQYLIQNSIWWIETLGLGGIRQDTYPYPDKEFMAKWAGAIMREYPNFSIVGEEWSYNPLLIGYWQHGHLNPDGYDSNLTHTMDFAMQQNIIDALNETEAWNTGLVKIYEGLANDFAYTDPARIMIFPDNHDMDRVFTALKEDVTNTQTALAYLLTLPRVAQLYYGTEILMQNTAKPGDHGLIRTDFPGGWDKDSTNAFTGQNLSPSQKEMQAFVKTLLNYRKHSRAISQGATLHFAPENGIYVLMRMVEEETVVLIINKNEAPVSLDLQRFDEAGLKGKKLRNIQTGELIEWGNTLKLNRKGSYLLTTKP